VGAVVTDLELQLIRIVLSARERGLSDDRILLIVETTLSPIHQLKRKGERG
jgi:hypothetical protein